MDRDQEQAKFERVLEALGPCYADVFLDRLIECFSTEFGWEFSSISALSEDQTHACTLRNWANGSFFNTGEYPLHGTPGEHLLQKHQLALLEKAYEAFPRIAGFGWSHGIESYLGHIIPGTNGGPIGLIEFFSGRKREQIGLSQRLLHILSSRLGAELERREQEKKLRDSQDRYRFLCEQASDMIHVHDLDGRWTFVNPALKRLVGFEPTDVIGKMPFRFFHPDDLDSVKSSIRAAIRSHGVFPATARVRTKNGSWRWLEARVQSIRDPNTDRPVEIMAITRDITVRKIEEEERRKIISRKLLHVEQTPLAVIEFTPNGNVTAWNPAAERIFGWTRDQIIGQHFSTFIPEDERAKIDELWSNLLSQRGGFRKTLTHTRPDGRKLICEWYNTPLIATDGEPEGETIGVASLVHDVTDRHAAEELIESQRLQMVTASKMSALGEMAAGIAHEINNPLAIIFGRVEQIQKLAAQGELSQERLLELTTNIASTADRIARIVAGLRFFARDGARDNYEMRALENLVDETLAFCKSRFQHHEVRLDIVPPSLLRAHSKSHSKHATIQPSTVLECRPVQISQVLLNLLNNAFDAVQNLADRWVRLSWRQIGNDIEIRVVDSGRGIEPKIVDRIMTPFFTTKELGKGTGLGLSISRGIIEAHGGTLKVDTVAKHTTFIIRVPQFQKQTTTSRSNKMSRTPRSSPSDLHS
ncbi:MAG: PAS domain S-box protein [Bdellovibrionaceae bacterium]|nr:PAS domain S-box protein [Pseudobdellovibrionaceae bacterium]